MLGKSSGRLGGLVAAAIGGLAIIAPAAPAAGFTTPQVVLAGATSGLRGLQVAGGPAGSTPWRSYAAPISRPTA